MEIRTLRGRPYKYAEFILTLDDHTVYSPATIALHGERKGLFGNHLEDQDLKTAKMKVRHTLSRFTKTHDFPIAGDGIVIVRGQGPIRGWRGARWKAALEPARLRNSFRHRTTS